ncbi:alpha/beta hydrolase [Ochrobactrum sp. BD61]
MSLLFMRHDPACDSRLCFFSLSQRTLIEPVVVRQPLTPAPPTAAAQITSAMKPRLFSYAPPFAITAAQRVGVRAPDRVKSIVTVCPLSAAGSAAPDEALAFFASTVRVDDAFRKLMRFMSGQLSDGWIEAKLEQSRSCASIDAKTTYLGMFRTNFAEEVRGSSTSIMLILGDHDPGLDEATIAPMFRSWYGNVIVATMPNCGHYPMEEAPPYFATTMERFLAVNS